MSLKILVTPGISIASAYSVLTFSHKAQGACFDHYVVF